MNEETCWQAVQARDAAQDGRFFYGVMTTGVYCRPSCRSRQPLRRNVRFYADVAAAQADGLRPCKRCRPDRPADVDPAVAKIQALCRHIEQHPDDELDLEALARRVHLSAFHLHRSFRAVTGVTPRQYVEAVRMRALRAGLKGGSAVTRAVYDAGFGSASRMYGKAAGQLGMTPKQYRAGGAGTAISYASAGSALGTLMIGATDRGLCFVQFGDGADALLAQLRAEYPGAQLAPMGDDRRAELDAWMRALAAHMEGAAPHADLPLDVRGTAFQMRVWSYLQQIPRGSVQSYAEVAQGIGAPSAVRAVAGACAANRIALLIPCHRVIRGDGGLGGYKWGVERKRTLLERERERAAAAVRRGAP